MAKAIEPNGPSFLFILAIPLIVALPTFNIPLATPLNALLTGFVIALVAFLNTFATLPILFPYLNFFNPVDIFILLNLFIPLPDLFILSQYTVLFSPISFANLSAAHLYISFNLVLSVLTVSICQHVSPLFQSNISSIPVSLNRFSTSGLRNAQLVNA